MKATTITKAWFEDVQDCVEFANPYFYVENSREYVEADVDEETFERVSKERGWM